MKEDDVVTAAALIRQESTETEKCRGEEQLLWGHTPTPALSRRVHIIDRTKKHGRSLRDVTHSGPGCRHLPS